MKHKYQLFSLLTHYCIHSLGLLIALAFSIGQANAYTKDKTYKLTILHTNDHHGRAWPNKEGEGGLVLRATLINQIRKEVQRAGGFTLVLDAGDVNTGVPQSDLQDAEPDFKSMDLIGYDAMTLGNHEFDKPFSILKKQKSWVKFPFLSANIVSASPSNDPFKPFIQKSFKDLKITIFGLTTENTPSLTKATNVEGLTFKPAIEVAKHLVPELKKKSDILIALTHIGYYQDEKNQSGEPPGDVTLAKQVPGIHVIVGGHTHTAITVPDVQNGTIIVQAEDWGKKLGRLDLEFLNGKMEVKHYELIPVSPKSIKTNIQQMIQPDAKSEGKIQALLTEYKALGDKTIQIEIGKTDTELVGKKEIIRTQETNLGNWITHVYRQRFQTDLAIVNSGGLRDSIPAGTITFEHLLKVLPFGGEVVIAQLKGSELKTYLESVLQIPPGQGGFPQISGLTAVKTADNKITELKVNGQGIVPEQNYKIALPDFLAMGGDKYPKLEFQKTGFIDGSILREFLLEKKTIKGEDFRIKGYIKTN